MIWKFSAAICLIVAISSRGFAGSLKLPDIDVEPHCKDAAALMAGSKDVFLTCMKQEQEHYDKRKS